MKRSTIFNCSAIAIASVVVGAQASATPVKGTAMANPMDSGFIANAGQWDRKAMFYASGPGVDTWVTKTSVKYDFFEQSKLDVDSITSLNPKKQTRKGQVVEMKFVGASPTPAATGWGANPVGINFITDRAEAKAGVFNEARLNGLYGGIDLKMYRDGAYPRFDFVVAPKANPAEIRFRYEGANNLRVGADGSLLVGTRFGEIPFAKLTAYQNNPSGRAIVPCKFQLAADGTVSFALGAYDRSKTLTIDPVVYSTLLGANGGDDIGLAVEADSQGYAYIAGQTDSVTFPITNGAYDVIVNGIDVFVTKMLPDASNIVYSTVVGGSSTDSPRRIRIDHFGRAIVVGGTQSVNFPTTPNAFDGIYSGQSEGFIFRLSANGSNLHYSSFVGGSAQELMNGLDIDSDDNIYFGGQTTSADVATTFGSLQPVFGGLIDSMVGKMNRDGTLLYMTYVGGTQNDTVQNLHVMPDGTACIAGSTQSRNFTTTPGAFDRVWQQGDGFIAKVAPDGSSFVFSTLLGGSAGDAISSLALDQFGNVFVIGGTGSVDFPRTPGVLDNVYNGSGENFLTKLSADGSILLFSTFMVAGGAQGDIKVDGRGVSYIIGNITFPGSFFLPGGADSDQRAYQGPPDPLRLGDGYLQVVNEAANGIVYGSYLGGDQDEWVYGMYLDAKGNVFITGMTDSYISQDHTPFPTTPGVFKPTMINDNAPFDDISHFDATLMKIKVRNLSLIQSFLFVPPNVAGTNTTRATITLTQPAPVTGFFLDISSSDPSVARAVDADGIPISQIFIPQGQSTGGFAVETFDVPVSSAVRFSIKLNDDVRSADMVVKPMLANFLVAPGSIVGGNSGAGAISLSQAAPPGGITVRVTSNRPDIAKIDGTGEGETDIFIPAGTSQVPITFSTVGVDPNPSSADGGTSVNFVAKVVTPSLAFTVKRQIRVLPSKLIALSVDPATIFEGEITTARLTLDGPAGPSGLRCTARIVQNGSAELQLLDVGNNGEVNIPAGEKEGFFRIKAKNANSDGFRYIGVSGGRQPSEMVRRIDVLTASIIKVLLDKTVVEGGQDVLARVQLDRAVVGVPTVISMRLNPPVGTSNFATLDQDTVTIPLGAAVSPPVAIHTVKSSSDKTITVEASRPGLGSATASFVIRGINFNFTLDPSVVIGGNNSTGSIRLPRAAGVGGVTVDLASSSPGIANVPASVTVPEGSNQIDFNISTSVVSALSTVTITAKLNLVPTPIVIKRDLKIKPIEPVLFSMEINPDTVVGGSSAIGTIRLDRPSPGNRSIQLTATADQPGGPFITVPESVSVVAGQTVVNFKVKTSLPPQSTVGTVVATLNGSEKSDTLVIEAPALDTFTIDPSTVAGGKTSVGTVTLNMKAPVGGLVIHLSASPDSTGTPFTSFPSTVTIPEGKTSATFNIKTTVPSRTVATAITASYTSGALTQVLTITRS